MEDALYLKDKAFISDERYDEIRNILQEFLEMPSSRTIRRYRAEKNKMIASSFQVATPKMIVLDAKEEMSKQLDFFLKINPIQEKLIIKISADVHLVANFH